MVYLIIGIIIIVIAVIAIFAFSSKNEISKPKTKTKRKKGPIDPEPLDDEGGGYPSSRPDSDTLKFQKELFPSAHHTFCDKIKKHFKRK